MFSDQVTKELTLLFSLVESNDILFGGTPEFDKELNDHFQRVIDGTLNQLSELGKMEENAGAKHVQTELLLDLTNTLLGTVQMNDLPEPYQPPVSVK